MSIDERIRLVDVLYGLLTAGNIENVFDAGDIQKNIGAIYNAAVHLDPETRSFVLQIIRQLAGFALHNIPHPNVPENLNILPAIKRRIKFCKVKATVCGKPCASPFRWLLLYVYEFISWR